jgi:hypothetical protein
LVHQARRKAETGEPEKIVRCALKPRRVAKKNQTMQPIL